MCTTTTDVLIVGAGPTGLTLATALAVRGIWATVVDHQSAGDNTSRAAVVHARTLEVLEGTGLHSVFPSSPRLALVRFDLSVSNWT